MRPLLRGPNWWVLPTSCEGFCFLRAGLRHQIDFRTLQLGVVADYTPDPASLSLSVSTPPKKARQITPRPKLGIHLPLLCKNWVVHHFSSLLRQWLFWGGEDFLAGLPPRCGNFVQKNLFFWNTWQVRKEFCDSCCDSAERWHVPKRCWWSFFWEDQGDLGWSKFQVFRLGAPLWAMWSRIISCKFDGMATGNTVFPKVWPMKWWKLCCKSPQAFRKARVPRTNLQGPCWNHCCLRQPWQCCKNEIYGSDPLKSLKGKATSF